MVSQELYARMLGLLAPVTSTGVPSGSEPLVQLLASV
jgi:hypothetical protein